MSHAVAIGFAALAMILAPGAGGAIGVTMVQNTDSRHVTDNLVMHFQ